MFISLGENFQLGIDCVAALSERRHVVFGWHMTPRGMPVELGFIAADGRFCRLDYISRHARPDVLPADPGAAVVSGFSLIVTLPPQARGAVMTLTSGSQSGCVSLSEPSINRDLFRCSVARDWSITFGLLAECRDRPELLPLMGYQYRPFGAFSSWMAQLPLLEGEARDRGILSRMVCSSSPAGEVLLDLRFTGRARDPVRLEVIALAQLRSEDGGPDEIALLPLPGPILRHAPGSSAFYAQLGWEHMARLRRLDLVVQLHFDEERLWLRCQPRPDTVPAFLDAVAAAPAGRPGQSLLHDVLARRRDVFQALAAAETAPAAPSPRDRPALAVIGVDEPGAVRLLHLLAPELEAEASSILLLGKAAEAASQVFLRRGRLPAEAAEETGALMKRAARVGAEELVTLGVARLAQAAIAGELSLLIRRARARGLGRLLVLHAMAGPTAALDDSLARHAALAEDPAFPWEPVSHAWDSPIGAEIVNEHLEMMWRAAPEPVG